MNRCRDRWLLIIRSEKKKRIIKNVSTDIISSIIALAQDLTEKKKWKKISQKIPELGLEGDHIKNIYNSIMKKEIRHLWKEIDKKKIKDAYVHKQENLTIKYIAELCYDNSEKLEQSYKFECKKIGGFVYKYLVDKYEDSHVISQDNTVQKKEKILDNTIEDDIWDAIRRVKDLKGLNNQGQTIYFPPSITFPFFVEPLDFPDSESIPDCIVNSINSK